MIDFMANIKNKKNMTKCNMKTLMATSALCVFFNGAIIYGMDGHTQENVNNNNNEQPEGQQVGQVFVMGNGNNDQEPKNNKTLNMSQYNETPNYKHLKEDDINYYKKLKKGKNNSSNIFFNYKDHFSLFFCCNLCNDKAQNRNKYIYRKYDELSENESNQGEDEISILNLKKGNVFQGKENPEEPNEDVSDDKNDSEVIKNNQQQDETEPMVG